MPTALQIRFRSALEFYQDEEGFGRIPKNAGQFNTRKTYCGILTTHGRRRMERSCELYLQATKTKIIFNPILNYHHRFHSAFITLTIPAQQVSVVDLKKNCFAPFIAKMQRDCKMNKYIWKLEFTEQGTPHFHIITDTWIHYKTIRTTWNTLLAKHGYLSEYWKEHTHYNANSTDIHSCKNQKNSVAYMVKYIQKSIKDIDPEIAYKVDTGYLKIGKIWDCSLSLKKHKYYTTIAQFWHSDILSKLMHTGKVILKEFEQFNLYIFKQLSPEVLLSDFEKKEYQLLINQINTT